ncbi:MAG TPA: SRPBCC domain-containing protein [Methylocella sp.]|nr:SRPBCC domain-containing protein [Methylocella sp.]
MSRATDGGALKLVVSRRFAAPPGLLFDAWFDPKAIGTWLFATPGGVPRHIEMDAKEGGGFAIHQQRGEILATHFGVYREIIRPSRIVFTLATSKPGPSTLVTVDIKPDGAGSLLTLTHEISPDWAAMDISIRAGWEGILEGLARASGEAGHGHTLIMHRTFDAPRLLVWKAWTEAGHLMRWLCPAGFHVLFAENDLRPGGKWRSGMRSPGGEDYIHCGEYLEIEKPSRLVFTHTWERNDLEPRAKTKITVALNEQSGKTSMIFIQAGLASGESALSHQGGWSGAFDNLARLAGELATAGHPASP